MNGMIANKGTALIASARTIETLTDTTALDAAGKALLKECAAVQGLIKRDKAPKLIDRLQSYGRSAHGV